MSREEIEAEFRGGLSMPVYDPIDVVTDILSAGLTGAGRAAVKTLLSPSFVSEPVMKRAATTLAKETAVNVGYGALSGSTMAALDEVGAGPVIQAIGGIIGPVATAALLQVPRKSLALHLRKIQAGQPDLFKQLMEVLEQHADKPFAQQLKALVDLEVTNWTAYHGTPHRWAPEPGFPHGRPRLDKIGSGEGAAAYGKGWYSAEAEDVAKEYQRNLAAKGMAIDGVPIESTLENYNIQQLVGEYGDDLKTLKGKLIEYSSQNADNPYADIKSAKRIVEAIDRGAFNPKVGSQLYKLDIPDDISNRLLDFDAPISKQSDEVKKALLGSEYDEYLKGLDPGDTSLHERFGVWMPEDLTGGRIYDDIAQKLGSKEAASEYLRSIGIPGNRYLDQMSRGEGKGSYNYVIWDQDALDMVRVLDVNGKPVSYDLMFGGGDLGELGREAANLVDDLTDTIYRAGKSQFENDPTALFKITGKTTQLGSLISRDRMTAPTEKHSININHDRIQSPEDIHALINTVAENLPDDINAARRGVQPQELTRALAEDLGWSPETLLARQRGSALNAEQITAARWIMMESADQLLATAKRIRAGENSDEVLAMFRDQLGKHAAIQAQVSGLTAEAGRALAAFRMTTETGMLRAKAINEALEASGGRDAVEDMASVLADVADASGGQLTTRQVNAATKKLVDPNWRDALLEAWIMGLLSGPQTHAVNMTSNTLFSLWQIPERKLASWISRTPYLGSGEIAGGEATAQLYGLVNGFKDALHLAGKALRTGESSDLLGKVEQRKGAFRGTAFGLDEGGVAARAVDLLGEVIRVPGRFLTAEDELFKGVGYRMEIQAQAFRQARAEGLDGPALASRIDELVANPPDHIRAAAIKAANYQTFTDALGEGGMAMSRALNAIPGARVVVPFFKTPVNLLKRSIERTPLAPVMSAFRADVAAGGARRDLALARMSLGSAVMGVTASLAAAGYISGGGPADKDMREIMRRDGWQPYSARVGDTWISYNRLDPIGQMIGMAADATEIIGQVGEAEADQLAGAAVASIAQNTTNKTYLKGVADFLDVFTQAQRTENASKGRDYLMKLFGSTIPAFVAQGERLIDPTLRNPRQYHGFDFVLSSLKERIPGYSKDLPPRRNLWGDPIVLEGGLGPDIISPLYTSTQKHDPVDEELLRLQVPIKMPPTQIGGVDLEPFEYDRYVVLAGNEAKDPATGLGLHDALAKLLDNPDYQRQSDGPDGGKAYMIKTYVRAYRQMAQQQVLQEQAALREVVDQRRVDKAKALQPPR